MKKYLFLIIALAVPLVLAGCSLVPANNNTATGPVDQTKSSGSLWKSSDGGKTWLDKSKGNAKSADISGADVISLAINSFDANTAYAGLRGAGILKTEDGGQTWTYLPFQPQKVYGLDLDPVDPRIVYASGVWQNRGKIFKSLDGGREWKEIYTAPSAGPLIIALAIDKKNPGVIYASTSDKRVIKTADAGNSWQSIFSAPGPVTKIAIDESNSNLVYLNVLDRGLFRSVGGVAKFEDISRRVSSVSKNNQNIGALEADPSNANWVYAAGGAGILRSRDAGKNWEKVEVLNDSGNFPVKVLAVSPANSNEIIYGAAQAVYKSVDGGVNWTTFQFETSKTINVLKYAASDAKILYLGLSK